ncbi:MAG: Hsp20/alpha crystallin family protein [Verrucomicrobiaceae bacterium]|nr:MAG: Hsp20/alpha crystallin family protein [Verrucomicrobiaceae bacterium]
MSTYSLFPNRLFNLADALLGERRDTTSPALWVPAADASEDETSYLVALELPGVNPTDVKVVVRDNVLTISGERTAVTPAEGSKNHISERVFGSFQRRFTLPKNADGGNVTAEFKNGVLLTSIPKREEVKPKEIEIKVA